MEESSTAISYLSSGGTGPERAGMFTEPENIEQRTPNIELLRLLRSPFPSLRHCLFNRSS